MHNGVVSDFTPIRRAMTMEMSDSAFANVHGSTDSEHLAALYMTYLTASEPDTPTAFDKQYPVTAMAEALHKAVTTVLNLQRKIIGDSKRQPNSLNLCATDGVKLVAYRFRNHPTSQPPSLYYSTEAGTTLNRKYPDHPDGADVKPDSQRTKRAEDHGQHLIIASEPSTYKKDEWKLIGKNQCVLASPDGKFEVKDIPYEKEWDAEDTQHAIS